MQGIDVLLTAHGLGGDYTCTTGAQGIDGEVWVEITGLDLFAQHFNEQMHKKCHSTYVNKFRPFFCFP